jgi:hypothetical protein
VVVVTVPLEEPLDEPPLEEPPSVVPELLPELDEPPELLLPLPPPSPSPKPSEVDAPEQAATKATVPSVPSAQFARKRMHLPLRIPLVNILIVTSAAEPGSNTRTNSSSRRSTTEFSQR